MIFISVVCKVFIFFISVVEMHMKQLDIVTDKHLKFRCFASLCGNDSGY